MSDYDRHEAAMYDALREDEEERAARAPWKEMFGVWFPPNSSGPISLPEVIRLCATKKEAQLQQIPNGSRIVRVKIYMEGL